MNSTNLQITSIEKYYMHLLINKFAKLNQEVVANQASLLTSKCVSVLNSALKQSKKAMTLYIFFEKLNIIKQTKIKSCGKWMIKWSIKNQIKQIYPIVAMSYNTCIPHWNVICLSILRKISQVNYTIGTRILRNYDFATHTEIMCKLVNTNIRNFMS